MNFTSKIFDFKPGERCVLLAEVGVNHNNDANLLFKLIDEGVKAGADIIKLQRFIAADEIAVFAPSADYQKKAGFDSGQLEMAQKLELSDELLGKAFDYCREKRVGFLCTPFEHSSVDFIADRLGCTSVKVASPEITNKPLIEHMARKFKSLLISTGASDLGECLRVLDWVRNIGAREVAFMHCVSEYPAPMAELNLKAIPYLREALGLPVGYSDHSEGIVAPIVAASLGACVVEKHYTLDKDLPGPDHKASANIAELAAIARGLKEVHLSLGERQKRAAPSEEKNLPQIRKSLTCAVKRLSAGTVITQDMLGIKRPLVNGAVEPFDVEKIIGLKIKKDKAFDQALLWEDFK